MVIVIVSVSLQPFSVMVVYVISFVPVVLYKWEVVSVCIVPEPDKSPKSQVWSCKLDIELESRS